MAVVDVLPASLPVTVAAVDPDAHQWVRGVVQVSDVLKSVNGKAVVEASQGSRLISAATGKVVLEFSRGGQSQTVEAFKADADTKIGLQLSGGANVKVTAVADGCAATGVLVEGDWICAINGTTTASDTQATNLAIAAVGDVVYSILRGDDAMTVTAHKPAATTRLGVTVVTTSRAASMAVVAPGAEVRPSKAQIAPVAAVPAVATDANAVTVAPLKVWTRPPRPEAVVMDELRSLFRKIDADGNQTLDLKEFVAGVASLDLPPTSDPAKAFQLLDVDGSGELSLDEICFALGPDLLAAMEQGVTATACLASVIAKLNHQEGEAPKGEAPVKEVAPVPAGGGGNVKVTAVADGCAATGFLVEGDQICAINGTITTDETQATNLAKAAVGDVVYSILRGDDAMTVTVNKPTATTRLGVTVKDTRAKDADQSGLDCSDYCRAFFPCVLLCNWDRGFGGAVTNTPLYGLQSVLNYVVQIKETDVKYKWSVQNYHYEQRIRQTTDANGNFTTHTERVRVNTHYAESHGTLATADVSETFVPATAKHNVALYSKVDIKLTPDFAGTYARAREQFYAANCRDTHQEKAESKSLPGLVESQQIQWIEGERPWFADEGCKNMSALCFCGPCWLAKMQSYMGLHNYTFQKSCNSFQ